MCSNLKKCCDTLRKLLKQIIITFDNKNTADFYTLRTELSS